MEDTVIRRIKEILDESIEEIRQMPQRFFRCPERDFTRNRKLSFHTVVSYLLSTQGGTLTTELLRYFNCSADTPSSSALVQQRAKIRPEAFSALFSLFVQKCDACKEYKGLRLLAADGSEIQIPTNPDHLASYYPCTTNRIDYNLLHLSAVYDLLQHTYTDAVLLGKKQANERKVLCSMVDRASLSRALLIADRGYENYNLMAHIQEKGWFFLIRIQDVLKSNCIADGLNLPNSEEFDCFIDLSLTNKSTKDVKSLAAQDRNRYKVIKSNQVFDFLPNARLKQDPTVFYHLPFRVIRFKLSGNTYETVVSNLPSEDFPPHELKKLYAMRWGIEASFRDLKYTLGVLQFHAKKVESIYQEIFAKLIMYNFTEYITATVIIHKDNTKYLYQANFAVAVHVCRQFFLGSVTPPDVEALIAQHVSPIRPDRSIPRNMATNHVASFIHRVA